jgi:DMSO/TMAO reductase YedYZ molybdopterin-dependent catalytic subunit
MRCGSRFFERIAATDLALRLLCTPALLFGQETMVQTRGFVGRRGAASVTLPPGQYLTDDFPVLSARPTLHVPLEEWELTIDNGSETLRRWSWKAFRELPTEEIAVDIHCVTRWSKIATAWEGVSLDTLLADIAGDASYALAAPSAAIRRTCRSAI